MRGFISQAFALGLIAGCLVIAACGSPQDEIVSETETPASVGEQPDVYKLTPAAATTTEVAQPTPSPTAVADQAESEANRFAELLSYVPALFADMHAPALFGPPLYLLDVERMRNDLGIGPVTGLSDYKDKLDLIITLGEAKQGLSIYPADVSPKNAESFDAWGWDFADVDSILHLLEDGLTILTGDFSRPDVLRNLKDKGEELPDMGLFSLYRINDGNAIVAVKPDVLIVASNPYPSPQDDVDDLLEIAVRMMIKINLDSIGIEDHPVVNQLFTELPDSWGVLLAPSPDVFEWEAQPFEHPLPDTVMENLESQGKLDPSLAPLLWDLMAIGFTSFDGVTDLILVYHYPGGEITEEEADLARTTLSELVSLGLGASASEDLFRLTDLLVKEPLLVVNGTTGHRNFLGNTIETRDYAVQCGLSLCREKQ